MRSVHYIFFSEFENCQVKLFQDIEWNLYTEGYKMTVMTR